MHQPPPALPIVPESRRRGCFLAPRTWQKLPYGSSRGTYECLQKQRAAPSELFLTSIPHIGLQGIRRGAPGAIQARAIGCRHQRPLSDCQPRQQHCFSREGAYGHAHAHALRPRTWSTPCCPLLLAGDTTLLTAQALNHHEAGHEVCCCGAGCAPAAGGHPG